MKRPLRTARKGLTIVEMMIALALLTVVFGSLGMVLDNASTLYEEGTDSMALEQRGHLAMSKVVDALRAADGPSAAVVPAPPFSSAQLECQLNEGFSGQSSSWTTPRRVEFDPAAGTLSWVADPGTAAEHSTVWCRGIPPMLEGEQFNGLDDNGNGLIDETGFCVTREGDLLTFRLTIEEASPGADPRVFTWESKVLIRN